MKFVDEVTITATAGKGGAGANHFRREKFVPFGGPDGGNGGHGGSIFAVGDSGCQTLLDFRFQPQWQADDGKPGGGSGRDGRGGKDLRLRLPLGTQIFHADTGELIADITEHGVDLLILRGGRGGKGNAFFKSATRQAPDFAQRGEDGESATLQFTLKLIADVGLVGLPNAGKSTLISRISSARPKIADYPFTTLTPNLGVVAVEGGGSFVVADVPGLIPGAHEGKGLGIGFLKHLERTRFLVHLVDTAELEPSLSVTSALDAYRSIREELTKFSEHLTQKPEIIVLTKIDASPNVEEITSAFREAGHQVLCISSVTGEGVQQLIHTIAAGLANARETGGNEL